MEWISPRRPPPPYADELRTTDEPYDASRLVRSTGFDGRFYQRKWARNTHVLWAFDPGTRIVNRLGAEEKRTVATFAAAAMKKGAERASAEGNGHHK